MQRFRLLVLVAALMLLAFLAGFVPKELQTRRMARELATTKLDLELANLQRQLGVASHEAQRNNFPGAMSAARAFFDGCRTAVTEHDFEGQPRTKIALSAYGSSGDMILGQLANGEPEAKERLASLYLTMHGMLERRQ